MAYIAGPDRTQAVMLPDVLDEYVTADNPVRFLEAFVAQPPCSKPPSRSSSGPPAAWTMPSRVINACTTIVLMVWFSLLWFGCLSSHENNDERDRRGRTPELSGEANLK